MATTKKPTVKFTNKEIQISKKLLTLNYDYGFEAKELQKTLSKIIDIGMPEIHKLIEVNDLKFYKHPPDIKISAYDETDWRILRLLKVADFIIKCNITKPISLHDHKGCLIVHWQNRPTEFQDFCVKLAWNKQNEDYTEYSWDDDFIGNYSEQLRNPLWQRKRLEILNRDNYTCTTCGNKKDTLHIHHKIYYIGLLAWEYSNTDLTVLCSKCHEREKDTDKQNAYHSIIRAIIN